MRVPSVLKSAGICVCMLVLPGLLSACSTTTQQDRQDRQEEDTLVVSAGGIDKPTARAAAMETGQHQCLARGGRQASMVGMQVTPPAMATMDDNSDSDASSTMDALEAATSEGELWRVTLTLRCR